MFIADCTFVDFVSSYPSSGVVVGEETLITVDGDGEVDVPLETFDPLLVEFDTIVELPIEILRTLEVSY